MGRKALHMDWALLAQAADALAEPSEDATVSDVTPPAGWYEDGKGA